MLRKLLLHKTLILEFFKFGIVGLLGLAVDTSVVYLAIHGFGWHPVASAIFSFPFAVTFTWVLNRHFTYGQSPKTPIRQEWARFLAVCSIGFVINRGVYTALVLTVPLIYANPFIALFAGSIAGMFFNFFVSRKWVFLRG
jgi:putative flippase GtrA